MLGKIRTNKHHLTSITSFDGSIFSDILKLNLKFVHASYELPISARLSASQFIEQGILSRKCYANVKAVPKLLCNINLLSLLQI